MASASSTPVELFETIREWRTVLAFVTPVIASYGLAFPFAAVGLLIFLVRRLWRRRAPSSATVPLKGDPDKELVLNGPFSLRYGVETYLRIAEVPYGKSTTSEISSRWAYASPLHEAVVIKHGGKLISGNANLILEYLKRTYDKPLVEPEKAEMSGYLVALTRLTEDHLYYGLLYYTFVCDQGWKYFVQQTKPKLLTRVLVLPFLRRAVWLRLLASMCLLNHTEAELAVLWEKDLQALSNVLGERHFLLGTDTPTDADLAAFSVLDKVLYGSYQSPLQKMMRRHGNLMRFVDRIRTKYYGKSSLEEAPSPEQGEESKVAQAEDKVETAKGENDKGESRGAEVGS